jgi:catechol 2,3-dioxygenase-like lactoylglutathione lyase family enzyme
MRLNYAIVFVSDMKRPVSFYGDVLGWPLRFESPNWLEFATEGATLALHSADAGLAASADATKAAPGTCRPGLSVADLDVFHLRTVQHRVTCVQEPKEVFGARIAQYLDPDGLVVSVGEERRAMCE